MLESTQSAMLVLLLLQLTRLLSLAAGCLFVQVEPSVSFHAFFAVLAEDQYVERILGIVEFLLSWVHEIKIEWTGFLQKTALKSTSSANFVS